LSNKSTYLAYKISYRKIGEIIVKAKFCGFHFHGKLCSEKPLTTSVLWKNFDQKVVSAGKWGMGFDAHFASFSVWNLAFLKNAFHFCSMWILTTTAFHSPKVHFHEGNADIFPLCYISSIQISSNNRRTATPLTYGKNRSKLVFHLYKVLKRENLQLKLKNRSSLPNRSRYTWGDIQNWELYFFISPSMPLTGLSLEMYIFHFEAISLSTHISGSKRPIFTNLVLFERCQ
jgi:hypothetical protein